MATTVADILEKAAELIEPEGAWLQEAYAANARGIRATDDGHAWPAEPNCFCVLGAIHWAAKDDTPGGHVEEAYLRALEFPNGYNVVEWNDTPSRTQVEVVAKLREAAAKAREQGL